MARKASRPDVVPCQLDAPLRQRINDFAETLKTTAHTLGTHGLDESEFYRSGIFNGAIQRIRGQVAAEMREKRLFVAAILDFMQDGGFIRNWDSAGDLNRHDYTITLTTGRIAVVELKGCLDGNNTTIFERPAQAQEFLIWSICPNAGNDPRHSVWSGIHTRLSAEIIHENKPVDGLIVWDWLCGSAGRPCPKLAVAEGRLTTVKNYKVTPPCIYLFPATVPAVRNNPHPEPHKLEDVGFLKALHECFGGKPDEVNTVRFHVAHRGNETVRTTTIERGGTVRRKSAATAIRRK